jgi:hypothetical protein
MQITFGKYDGKTSQEVVVKHASYAKWVLDQSASGSLGSLQTELKRLISRLDNKPYTCTCSKTGCTRPVSRLTAYANNDVDLYPWCAICDPYSLGANSGKLTVVNSYKDVLNHVTIRCGATKGGYDRIVKAYARSKGLPSRVGAASATAFFA